jgi:hypothetical protein
MDYLWVLQHQQYLAEAYVQTIEHKTCTQY